MGPRKAKQEAKFKKPTFYSIVYTGYRVQTSPTCCPSKKNGVPRPIDRALGNCDRMHDLSKQILALFQQKKLKKGDIHQKRNEGRKKRAFPKRSKKGDKRASTFGKGLPGCYTTSDKIIKFSRNLNRCPHRMRTTTGRLLKLRVLYHASIVIIRQLNMLLLLYLA